MATARPCLAQLSRTSIPSSRPITQHISTRLLSTTASCSARGPNAAPIKSKREKAMLAGNSSNPQKNKKKGEEVNKKKKKTSTSYKTYNQNYSVQFSLVDAMRYLRAFEVGQKGTSVKYEMAVKLKSPKNGPVVRNRLRLPHPVKTDIRICVICPPDSKYAKDALAAGAVVVGEEDVFEAVKDGRIEFDRCICQTDSLAKMNKAGMGRVLGPRGLMPSSKLGTVVVDPASILKDLVGGSEYRERLGVVRMSVGQLGFTPEELQRNTKVFIESVKKDINRISEKVQKEFDEIVLSTTNGPGFPLNGDFTRPDALVTARDLSTPL